MTKLLIFGMMCLGALLSLVLVPLLLLKVLVTVILALVVIPMKILGALLHGLFRVVFTGIFWLALLVIPLALIGLPFTILAFGAWVLYRAFRPRRPVQAYVVS